MRWEPERAAGALPYTPPSFFTGIGRGIRNRCPVCGEGRIFSGYLGIVEECAVCRAPLGTLRADDAPPYVVIFLTGHLLLPGVLWVEEVYEPPMWLHMVVWLPLFAIVCTLLLRPVKGGVVGYMIYMGFLEKEAPPEERPEPIPQAAAPRAIQEEDGRG